MVGVAQVGAQHHRRFPDRQRGGGVVHADIVAADYWRIGGPAGVSPGPCCAAVIANPPLDGGCAASPRQATAVRLLALVSGGRGADEVGACASHRCAHFPFGAGGWAAPPAQATARTCLLLGIVRERGAVRACGLTVASGRLFIPDGWPAHHLGRLLPL